MSTLKVKVISGRNLAPKDANGLSDPYCVVKVGEITRKTLTISRSLNPVWNADMTFSLSKASSVIVTVWDKDLFGTDFLGQFKVPLADVKDFGDFNAGQWYRLLPRNLKDIVSGDIYLKMGWLSDADDLNERPLPAIPLESESHSPIPMLDSFPEDERSVTSHIAGVLSFRGIL